MPVVFPEKGNPYFPLPPDYPELSQDGKRKARRNAASLRGNPYLEVTAWYFFREYYLRSQPPGAFYAHGTVESPQAHAQIIHDWAKYPRSVTEAPRGMAKSTLVREQALRKLLTVPHYEVAGFYSGLDAVTKSILKVRGQIENNQRIIDDFGKMRTPRGQGIWNTQAFQLKNGAMFTGRPIRGAVLGMRPHEIFMDDVERDDSLTQEPADLAENFREFFFNAIYPMTEGECKVRVIGTIVDSKTFIHWLQTTNDPRIKNYWHRILYKAEWIDPSTGEQKLVWKEKMSAEWLAERRAIMGETAYARQYLNQPATDEDKPLKRHPLLTTYWLANADAPARTNPLSSNALLVTHQLTGWKEDELSKEKLPEVRKVVRPFRDVLAGMRRFICVDYATTYTPTSDFSVVHVMGLENSPVHTNTLYSLDIWIGRVRRERLIKQTYEMARKWGVYLIGVEAYPLQQEYFDRMHADLGAMFKSEGRPPAIVPLKFPPKFKKEDKIEGLTWRFTQFCVKLPADREDEAGYRALNYQIDHYTRDLVHLQFDDALDSMAMSQAIGKQRAPVRDIIARPEEDDPLQELKQGNFIDEVTGLPHAGALDWTQVSSQDLREIMDAHYDSLEAEGVSEWVNRPC